MYVGGVHKWMPRRKKAVKKKYELLQTKKKET